MNATETSETDDTNAVQNDNDRRGTCHAHECDAPIRCLTLDAGEVRNSTCGHRQPLHVVQSRAGEEGESR